MTTRRFIRYRGDYKYQLAEGYKIDIAIKPKQDIKTEFINLDVNGELTIKQSYAWDGPSGPVIDTKENLRASLVHDALYQLMRNKELVTSTHRKAADQIFKDLCKMDGVSNFRASMYYKALRKFGRPVTSPENKKKIRRAPKP